MTKFQALRVNVQDSKITRAIETCSVDDLPSGDVLIHVCYSSLNYKDALSARGHRGVTRHYPHTPGIDAAGTVVRDMTGTFVEGDPVVVLGFDLGMNTWGGFSQYIQVPKDWVLPLPDRLSLSDAMRLGTAGVTAGYCVEKLLHSGLSGDQAKVLVTAGTSGVGSLAMHLLSSLGYQVTVSTGKAESENWLKALGAKHVVPRELLSDCSQKALHSETYDAAIDSVGGETLINILKSLRYGASVAACGLLGGTTLSMDIYPFILRGVNLLGVASADASLHARQRVLSKFAAHWRLPRLADMAEEIELADINDYIEAMLQGQLTRRVLVKIS